MARIKSPICCFLFLFSLVAIPTLHANELENETFWKAHSTEFDEYWKARANEADKENRQAYQANPYEVVGNLSASVKR